MLYNRDEFPEQLLNSLKEQAYVLEDMDINAFPEERREQLEWILGELHWAISELEDRETWVRPL